MYCTMHNNALAPVSGTHESITTEAVQPVRTQLTLGSAFQHENYFENVPYQVHFFFTTIFSAP